jgi:hypothetical protein
VQDDFRANHVGDEAEAGGQERKSKEEATLGPTDLVPCQEKNIEQDGNLADQRARV